MYISYETFCCVVSLCVFTSCAVFWRARTAQRHYITKRLIRDLLSNKPNCFSFVTKIQLVACVLWTLLTGPLQYKYRVIFALVLSVNCTLQNAVGWKIYTSVLLILINVRSTWRFMLIAGTSQPQIKPKTIFVAVLIASSSKAFEPNFDNSRQIRNVYNRTIQVYCVLRLAIRCDLTWWNQLHQLVYRYST